MKPIAAWADYGRMSVMGMGDNGQLYELPMVEGAPWTKLGPPMPGTEAVLRKAEMDIQLGRPK